VVLAERRHSRRHARHGQHPHDDLGPADVAAAINDALELAGLEVALARNTEDRLAASWDGTGGAEVPRTVLPLDRFHSPSFEPGRPTEQTKKNVAERPFDVPRVGG
jgi:hypothetical protein